VSFAADQGVDGYLPQVLEMTRRQFPAARRIDVNIEDDPEIVDDRHVVIAVEVPDLDPEEYVAAKFRWGQELFRLCPAPLVCVFRCALSIAAP
jgi:hypothetical protein